LPFEVTAIAVLYGIEAEITVSPRNTLKSLEIFIPSLAPFTYYYNWVIKLKGR
jgi:hypothetical protein